MDALKLSYNQAYMKKLGKEIKKNYSNFDQNAFQKTIFNSEWKNKELKERMDHISRCLHQHLNLPYKNALQILEKTAPGFGGWEAMFFPHFVQLYGLKDWKLSIDALEHFTQFSSSEFAVRPFILMDPKKMMKKMLVWSKHKNVHVRRLASEGCRPRLPWAMALNNFKENPSPIFPILNQLKQDPELYVRKSVANNINDISKDHPEKAIKLSQEWKGKHPHTDWILKHGGRSLLKGGHPEIFSIFNYDCIDNLNLKNFKANSSVSEGENLTLNLEIQFKKSPFKLRLEYAIYFKRANGQLNKKVFHISDGIQEQKVKNFVKSHSFKQINTRKYYPGRHQVSIILNGIEVQKKNFILKRI